jgi:outer membrane protein assembly factor BamD (BamD/ComL family)
MNRLYFTLVLAFIFSACASTINISENLSPAELIQRAHEAMDRNRYKTAIQYYQALHDRNQSNTDLRITAEYHIAFIHYKQKKYEQAKEELNAVLKYYDTPDEELLPQHFKKLSQIVLKSIEEKDKRNKPIPEK